VNHDQYNHKQECGGGESSANSGAPISPWLVGAFIVAIFWGGFYLAFNSGGFRQDVYESNAVSWAGGGTQAAAPVDPKVVGKRLYSQNCVVCHQANGQGVAGQFPPLAGSEWVNGSAKHGENHLILLMLHGHQGPMQVMGGNYNNAMPQWKQLSDDQIAAVLTYIRSEWGNKSDAVEPASVALLRKEHSAQSEAWTQAQLMSMPPATGAKASNPAK
jgi:mono/diheme cytochrome c family protein